MYSRTIRGSCHVWLHLPRRYVNGCIDQYTHIVQSTYSKWCLWFVLAYFLTVLHKVSPQFEYILLIVALPYSFIRGVRLLLFWFSSCVYCYFVHNMCKSAVFINIVTVMATPLSDSRGCDLRSEIEIYPFQLNSFVVEHSAGLEKHQKLCSLPVVVPL